MATDAFSESINLTPDQEEKILQYMDPFLGVTSAMSNHRARCEHIDRLLESSVDTNLNSGHKDADGNPCDEEGNIIPADENINVPIIGPQISTLSAELIKLFLSEDPPLQMVSAPKSEAISNKYNLLFSRYSRQLQWRRNLVLLIRDAVQYNVCAAEILWKRRLGKAFTSGVNVGTGAQSVTDAFEFGENIGHLNIYNITWDASVPVNQVPYEAAYAGYFKKFTRIALVQYLRNSGIDLSPELFQKIKDGAGASLSDYYIPQVNDVPSPNDVPKVSLDDMFSGKESSAKKKTMTSTVEHICKTFYIRVLPADFGLITSDDPTEIAIFRVIIVNDRTLVDFRRMSSQHNMIPIVFGQIDETAIGLNTYTIAEELAPLQNAAEKLYKGDIASLRRLIADRGIFDPNYLDSIAINSKSPTAKIPLKKSYSGVVTPSQAYHSIPYSDPSIGSRIKIANGLASFASEITSANTIMRGGFVPGNKTAQEFQATMAGAGNRILAFAIFFDDQFFGPVRTIVRSDILQHQGDIKIYDRATGDFVEIQISELQDNQIDFDIAAGLLPAEALQSVDFLQTIFQVVMSNEAFNQEYKVMDMLTHIASIKGLRYLDRFARTDEEKQAMMQQQLQFMMAQQGIQNGNNQPQSGTGPKQAGNP